MPRPFRRLQTLPADVLPDVLPPDFVERHDLVRRLYTGPCSAPPRPIPGRR